MSFSKMMELLQIKNKGKIVFVNAGNFYIAVGKDAVLLHKILDLKTTCMKPEICKAGFPINSLEKYTEKLSESKYSFIVYYFNQETEELKEVVVMNLCFLIGKIISEINFKFVLNSKNISIVYFKIELNNKSIVEVKAYNELADYCYSKLKKNYIIAIQGYLSNDTEIVIEEFII